MLVETDAIVLHVQDYLESSRILRLATREAGVVSALARGARRPRSRFGAALDLFTGGVAQLAMRPGRDLHTLTGFDALRARHALGADLARFTAASALAELALRFVGDAPNAAAHDALADALDALGARPADQVPEAGLAGAWHLVAALGFAPAVDDCAACHEPVAPDVAAPFSHRAGGVLCARCAALEPGARALPPRARDALRAWTAGEAHGTAGPADVAAHQRLLRLFLQAHLAEGRSLPAFEVWEREHWERR
ncbi:MAG TPA: DNA repair protein RecO [Gemmatimonadaceae bacterium]|nr:DNA repair protein RecO [Gemmatimonadaceae bacterium]